jgi:Amino acid permease
MARAPLVDAVAAGGWAWAMPVVVVGGAAAALGGSAGAGRGVGRTALAMARQGDLPRWLAAVHPRYRVPHRAEITLTVIVSVLVLTVDVRGAIGFSSFGVLLYYLIANLSALTQPLEQRRFPRWLQGSRGRRLPPAGDHLALAGDRRRPRGLRGRRRLPGHPRDDLTPVTGRDQARVDSRRRPPTPTRTSTSRSLASNELFV